MIAKAGSRRVASVIEIMWALVQGVEANPTPWVATIQPKHSTPVRHPKRPKCSGPVTFGPNTPRYTLATLECTGRRTHEKPGFMQIEPLSSNRTFIYYLMRRSMRYHSPISASCIFDITDTLARIDRDRAAGRKVGLVSAFIKATAICIEKYPQFNQRMFHNMFGSPRIATFDEISCNTVVGRQAENGEAILLPLVLRRANTMSVEDIQGAIRHYKTAPLNELDAASQLQQVSRLPRWLIRFLHWRFRREPGFLISKVGTYAVSALPHHGTGGVASFTPTSQTAFFPTTLQEQVLPIDGEPAIRTTLTCTITGDHGIVDGLDVQQVAMELKRLIENPDLIFGPVA